MTFLLHEMIDKNLSKQTELSQKLIITSFKHSKVYKEWHFCLDKWFLQHRKKQEQNCFCRNERTPLLNNEAVVKHCITAAVNHFGERAE